MIFSKKLSLSPQFLNVRQRAGEVSIILLLKAIMCDAFGLNRDVSSSGGLQFFFYKFCLPLRLHVFDLTSSKVWTVAQFMTTQFFQFSRQSYELTGYIMNQWCLVP